MRSDDAGPLTISERRDSSHRPILAKSINRAAFPNERRAGFSPRSRSRPPRLVLLQATMHFRIGRHHLVQEIRVRLTLRLEAVGLPDERPLHLEQSVLLPPGGSYRPRRLRTANALAPIACVIALTSCSSTDRFRAGLRGSSDDRCMRSFHAQARRHAARPGFECPSGCFFPLGATIGG
jgi:hypothetical protein